MPNLTENEMGDRMMTGLPYAQGGGLGSVGLDTISSPDISQNPAKFKYPQTASSPSNINTPTPEDYEDEQPKDRADFEGDVDAIKNVVTPDEILAGMQYCLKKMVFKSKDAAKQIVVACLKKDPKYFSKLKMYDMDGTAVDEMILESEQYYTPREKEVKKIFRQMQINKANKKQF